MLILGKPLALAFLRQGLTTELSLALNSQPTCVLLFVSAEITGMHTIPNHTSFLAVSHNFPCVFQPWAFALVLCSAWNTRSLRGTYRLLPDSSQIFVQLSLA